MPMNKEDIVRSIMSDYDMDEEKDVRRAVGAFIDDGIDFNDGSVEVSDIAEYVVNTGKYWKKEE